MDPTFKGKPSRVIDIDPEEIDSIAVRFGKDRLLMVIYDVDEHGSGFFRIRLLGFNEGGSLLIKEFRPNQPAPAFFGEISVSGPGDSELWASFGYEDLDLRDSEGNITNKPREIRIHPKRDD